MAKVSLKPALLVGSILAPIVFSAPVHAQVAASPAPGQTEDRASEVLQGSAPQGGLQDIVVTARKREESVQDTPVAVTAISEEVILNRDVTSVEKIAAIAPQFNVGRASNGSGAQLTLRGIGSSSTSIGIEQSVAVVVDGAYYGQGRIINEGFFDLQRVEVLKGPQALFFGKNATAGVISLTTNDPGPDPEFIVRAGYEFKAQQYRLEAIASTPLTDRLGFRLAGRYSKMEGGYYDNVSVDRNYATFDIATGVTTSHIAQPSTSDQPGEEEILARATLKWEADDNLTVSLKGSYNRNEVASSSWNYAAYECGLPSGNSQLTGYPCGEDFVTHQNRMPADIAAVFPLAKNGGELYNDYESYGVTLNMNYDSEYLNISSVTNYQRNDNAWTCACDFQSSDAGTWATEDSSWEAVSTEFRVLSQLDGPFNFLLGALYQKTKRDFEQWIMFANIEDSSQPDNLRYVATSKTSYTNGETFAVFGQATIELLPTLELAGGVRYTDETKDSFFAQPYNNAALTAIFRPADAPLGTVTASQHFKDWSPEATLTWKPLPDLLVYGAYKTAYKSGGFSNGGINSGFSNDPEGDLTFNPETVEGFEIGVKSTILDNQLRLNATIFTYDYNDLQVDFFNSPIFAFQTLTADARTRGVEVEFEFAPRSVYGLNVYGSINYTEAEYTDFDEGPCYAGQTPAEGCTPLGPITSRQNLTGTELSVAPEWTGNLGVSYDMAVGADYMIGFNADARYSGSYLASGFGNPLSKQDSYVTLDAGVRFGAEDGNWQIAVIGKNLTNEFYVTGVVDGPSTGGGTGTPDGIKADQLGFGSVPRTVMVELTKRF
ncbi:TonB-dependent receptor [Novosphingobium marinum]|uniref:Outer membrane receptor protein involved in Fe transport n=1 Tax=Novosphingobium marinum TaxID=1514948 RepID=A0A7Y9XT43_9SPHN|nr:TonB-dependent receptor [Novosphingobium marinum]NYH94064.1 outer membrane receptor protein involved in Fe transport [Novosphingobium marinum]GGC19310.1 TonB-dependent receptor [Novosphingobium marinum]